jgi:excisionase family DNA binding protein
MKTVSNDDLIRAVFTATDEAKTRALAILEGRASTPALSQVEGPSRPEDNSPLLLTMGEAAQLLNVSRATLWRTIKSGRLPKVELYPGAFRLRRSDILALVNGRDGSPSRPSSPCSMRHAPCTSAPEVRNG